MPQSLHELPKATVIDHAKQEIPPVKLNSAPGATALEEDPYQGDDKTYQEHFRKTFITENQKKMMGDAAPGESKQIWTLHDMIIPAGKTAKLIRIKDPNIPDFRISEVCDKIKFINAAPVIILAGAMTQRA